MECHGKLAVLATNSQLTVYVRICTCGIFTQEASSLTTDCTVANSNITYTVIVQNIMEQTVFNLSVSSCNSIQCSTTLPLQEFEGQACYVIVRARNIFGVSRNSNLAVRGDNSQTKLTPENKGLLALSVILSSITMGGSCVWLIIKKAKRIKGCIVNHCCYALIIATKGTLLLWAVVILEVCLTVVSIALWVATAFHVEFKGRNLCV